MSSNPTGRAPEASTRTKSSGSRSDFTIDTFAGGQAVMYAGDRGRMDRVTIRDSAVTTGTGGIWVIGGNDFLATHCHVESGDDCLQLVPIGHLGALLCVRATNATPA